MMVNRNSMIKDSESFKNVEKDLAYIVSKISEDDQLLKLLSLQEEKTGKLTNEEKREILKECVRIVPIVKEDSFSDKGWTYLSIQFSNFMRNENNPEHRDKYLIFNIISDFSTVNMKDFKLRPYLIAGRIDALFDKKALAGTYTINFLSAETITLDENTFGMGLAYAVTYSLGSDRNDDEE